MPRVRQLTLSLIMLTAIAVAIACVPPPAPQPGRVVLNELMYHPADDDESEFIELHNPGDTAIDLSGWCFSDGVSGCFGPGVVLAPGGFLVSAGDPVALATQHGVQAGAEFEGKLSNGGETIELTDAEGSVALRCSYGDDPPWPVAADGDGPSLERRDSDGDCSDPAAWVSSVDPAGATPGRANSSADPSIPSILDVQVPSSPLPGTSVPVTVSADRAAAVAVEYRVGMNAPLVEPLHDDGSHGDQTPGDGVWSGTLPAVTAGELLRYRIEATSPSGAMATAPAAGDPMHYRGVIGDDGEQHDLPLLRWYMDPVLFETMTTEHLEDGMEFPAVLAVGDEVFDNATVNVKGASSVLLPKKKYEFNLPDGYLLEVPWLEHGIDEFDLQARFDEFDPIDEEPAWRVFEHFGVPTVQSQFVRVHKNERDATSRFYGTYLLREDYDGKWRDREGFVDGMFFKAGQQNKSHPESGNAVAEEFISQVTSLAGDELERYLLDHLDVPAYINYMAVSAAVDLQHWDWYVNVNQYVDERTGRWQYLPLDLDSAFNANPTDFDGSPETFEILFEPTAEGRVLESAVFQLERFREMYFRRVISVVNEMQLTQMATTIYDEMHFAGEASYFDDHFRWLPDKSHWMQEQLDAIVAAGGDPEPPEYFAELSSSPTEATGAAIATWWDPSIAREIFHLREQRRVQAIAAYQADGLLPGAQEPSHGVSVVEVGTLPGGEESLQYATIHNSGPAAVDVSGWTVDGLDLSLPQGSVVPAGSCAVVVRDDVAFKAYSGGGNHVVGEFGPALPPSGSFVLRNEHGQEVARLDYEADPSGSAGPGCPGNG